LAEFYYPNSPYVFSVVSSDFLGAVYEKFLESEVRITSGKIVSEKKPELRKKTGVFYTPTKITDYLVKNALNLKLQKTKTRPKI
jgi:type I restriction-modification system DNA methylase subunit